VAGTDQARLTERTHGVTLPHRGYAQGRFAGYYRPVRWKSTPCLDYARCDFGWVSWTQSGPRTRRTASGTPACRIVSAKVVIEMPNTG